MRRINRLWAPSLLCALLMAVLAGATSARPNPAPLASAAKTLTVSASDCYPSNDDVDYFNAGKDIMGNAGTVTFICPAHFPEHGEHEVLGITMYAYDYRSGSGLQYKICASPTLTDPSSGGEDEMGEICSTGSSSTKVRSFTISGTALSPNSVDPEHGMYFWVEMGSHDRLKLYGFHLSYSTGPSIDIEKHTNGHDADEAPGALVLIGGAVEWEYKVTNSGYVNLTGITVTDDQGVAVDCGGKDALIPGESMTCTASGTAIAGQYSNVGTASGTGDGQEVSDEDPSHYWGTAGPILSTYLPLVMRNY